jgi:hypothetical protein
MPRGAGDAEGVQGPDRARRSAVMGVGVEEGVLKLTMGAA